MVFSRGNGRRTAGYGGDIALKASSWDFSVVEMGGGRPATVATTWKASSWDLTETTLV